MSRDINIDLRKPLEEQDIDDLRYAVDRNLLDPADEVRVSNWLKKKSGAEASPADETDSGEEMSELLTLLDGTVPEVNDAVDAYEGLTAHDVELLVEAEKAGKNRGGVIGHLESIEFEDEEEEESEEDDS